MMDLIKEKKMAKTVAILQSNYIPWKGYFDLIRSVDEFILYDEVQYTRRDWRNRNKIKTADGTQWLTVPVEVKGKYFQKINETLISESGWEKNHWTRICSAYSKAPYFKEYYPKLVHLLSFPATNLAQLCWEQLNFWLAEFEIKVNIIR
ncbi:MAG: WbqC family protein, partial [Gemmataceae bacterium]|nr:WbqC family protein [Gemmataceae bacterium]